MLSFAVCNCSAPTCMHNQSEEAARDRFDLAVYSNSVYYTFWPTTLRPAPRHARHCDEIQSCAHARTRGGCWQQNHDPCGEFASRLKRISALSIAAAISFPLPRWSPSRNSTSPEPPSSGTSRSPPGIRASTMAHWRIGSLALTTTSSPTTSCTGGAIRSHVPSSSIPTPCGACGRVCRCLPETGR